MRNVLGREGLEGVMRVEAGILSEMRGLDGERKALVYDNYSKLIAATETIKKVCCCCFGFSGLTHVSLLFYFGRNISWLEV